MNTIELKDFLEDDIIINCEVDNFNLTQSINIYLKKFFDSENLFSLHKEDYSVSLKTVRTGYKLDIITYIIEIKDYLNKVESTITLKKDSDNNYSTYTHLDYFIYYKNQNVGQFYHGGYFPNIDSEKIKKLIKIRNSLKKITYEKDILAPKNNYFIINKQDFDIPKYFIKNFTIKNLNLIKNIENIDINFLKIIENLNIKNTLSITPEESEMIEILTDTKTPEWFKNNNLNNNPQINFIKKLFGLKK